MHAFGAATMRDRSQSRVPAVLATDLHDFVGVRGDDYLLKQGRGADSVIHASDQGHASDFSQHLARKASGGEPGGNDGDGFHAVLSVNFPLHSCNRRFSSVLRLWRVRLLHKLHYQSNYAISSQGKPCKVGSSAVMHRLFSLCAAHLSEHNLRQMLRYL